jgi:hypothetical protein
MLAPKHLFRVRMLVPKQKCHPDRSVAQWRDLLFFQPLFRLEFLHEGPKVHLVPAFHHLVPFHDQKG